MQEIDIRSGRSAVVSMLVLQSWGSWFDSISSGLSDETLDLDSMTCLFQEKLLARAYCDEIGNYDVPYMLSPRGFRPDLLDINSS